MRKSQVYRLRAISDAKALRERNAAKHREYIMSLGINPDQTPRVARNKLLGDERHAVKWHAKPKNSKQKRSSSLPKGCVTFNWSQSI
jgi:hypothetical protein